MNAPYREEFRTVDDFLIAVVRAGISPHETDRRLRWATAAGANEGIPAEGGFGVPEDFALDLIEGVEEFASIYPLTDRQPMCVLKTSSVLIW